MVPLRTTAIALFVIGMSSVAFAESNPMKACYHEKDVRAFFDEVASETHGFVLTFKAENAAKFLAAFNALPPVSHIPEQDEILVVASEGNLADGEPVKAALVRFIKDDKSCGTASVPTTDLLEILATAFPDVHDKPKVEPEVAPPDDTEPKSKHDDDGRVKPWDNRI